MAKLTNDLFKMLSQKTSEVLRNITSSPVSVGGHTLSVWQTGLTIDLFGQVLAPANRSARPDNAKAKPTIGIYGPNGSASRASIAPQQSLANRLQARLPTGGLTMFIKGWNQKITPLGRLYCQLAVSARPTNAIDCGLWPTTRAADGNKGVRTPEGAAKEIMRNKWPCLSTFAMFQTPRALSFDRSHQPGMNGAMQSWLDLLHPTPRANKWGLPDSHGKVAVWATPRSSPNENRTKKATPSQLAGEHGQYLAVQAIGATLQNGSNAPTANGGSLNPAFPCWLMGYPTAWESCADMVTRLSRKSRPNS